MSLGTTKIGVLHGKAAVLVYMHGKNPHLKSMGNTVSADIYEIKVFRPYPKINGNTVSADIYEIKVFRPYPVILYRLRLDHSIHWWKKIGVPRNDQNWRTRW